MISTFRVPDGLGHGFHYSAGVSCCANLNLLVGLSCEVDQGVCERKRPMMGIMLQDLAG